MKKQTRSQSNPQAGALTCTPLQSVIFAIFNYLKSNHYRNFSFYKLKSDLDKIDNIHAIEQALFSKELGVAGTVDCIAEYEGELAVIDFKTSKKPKPEKWIEHYYVQCAAYACMLYEMTGIMVKKFVIIMSCENGECVVYEQYDKRKYINLLSKYIREFVEFKLQTYA